MSAPDCGVRCDKSTPSSAETKGSRANNLSATSGHALRRNAAGAFGPDLAKKLAQLVKMEKNVMRSLETVAKERMEVAVRAPSLSPLPLLRPRII